MVNEPLIASTVKSFSVTVYVPVTPVIGTVTPPKLISPFLNTNSFAILLFFFHFPKEIFIL